MEAGGIVLPCYRIESSATACNLSPVDVISIAENPECTYKDGVEFCSLLHQLLDHCGYSLKEEDEDEEPSLLIRYSHQYPTLTPSHLSHLTHTYHLSHACFLTHPTFKTHLTSHSHTSHLTCFLTHPTFKTHLTSHSHTSHLTCFLTHPTFKTHLISPSDILTCVSVGQCIKKVKALSMYIYNQWWNAPSLVSMRTST